VQIRVTQEISEDSKSDQNKTEMSMLSASSTDTRRRSFSHSNTPPKIRAA
jgi:hypothetical protein